MDQLTVYRAKGKTVGLTFLFKYNLKGHLRHFEIIEGELNPEQKKWLFIKGNFPADESTMKDFWLKDKKYRDTFLIEKSPANLSFDALWELYDHKVKRHKAEEGFNKLTEADRIKLFISVPGYNQYLDRKRTGKMMLPTFINQRCFEDEWHKA